MTLNREDPLPLYQQMYDLLRADLEKGVYSPGEQIPTELELARRHGVSRITVKQAIQKLVLEGRLYRIQGKGTFVARPRLSRKLKTITSFTEELKQRNLRPGIKLLLFEVQTAVPKVARALGIGDHDAVAVLRRLRLGDDEPMGLQTAYLPFSLVHPLLREEDKLATGSLYSVLEGMGLRPVRAVEEYSAVLLDTPTAHLLGVRPGSPAFAVERVSYLPDDRPIEFVESFLRADRYTLQVELEGV
ncbi:MAG TPA: GntR family transcriptional regulator [Firmicutes bacterium]|nr:GntR family transcriptional regulator [Bacillota bacterium]